MKRIKTLCAILLIAFFGNLYQGAVLPFVEGLKFGITSAKYNMDRAQKTENFILMDVVAKQIDYLEKTEINQLTGETVMTRPTNMTVMIQNLPEKPLWWGVSKVVSFVSLLVMLALGIWIPFLVVRVVRSLQHSAVFDRKNLVAIHRIGVILITMGILGTLLQVVNVASARAMIDLANYSFSYGKAIDFNPLIMGIVVLIMNEVLRIGTEMKEEQDLTI